MGNIKLAFTNITKNFKNAKELKSAFITTVIGMAINNIAFVIIWYYFSKTVGVLNGWEPIDIFGLYTFSTTSFGIVCSIFYGVFNLPFYISTGNFDKYLLTPKNTLLKVATSSISTSAIGDFLFGITCFIIYIILGHLSLVQILMSILLIAFSVIIFFAFSLICMSISFYLMDGENVSQGLYGTFLSVSLYHGGTFTGILKAVFIFVMPSLLLGAIPVEIVKNMSIINLIFICLLTIFWLVLSIMFFYKSMKRYESNNFFGFGG